jgi:drug/metabolite transporter (DMT)-like permease
MRDGTRARDALAGSRLKRDSEGLGLLQVLAAVLAGVGNNFCFKLLAALPISHIVVMRSLGAMLAIGIVVAAHRDGRMAGPTGLRFSAAAVGRALCEAVATVSLVVAITIMPMALVTGILMTIPIFVTLIGRVAFQEPTPEGAWTAIGAGFIGALLVVQPGLEISPVGMIAAAISAGAFAARDALTRRVPSEWSSLSMTLLANMATLGTGLFMLSGADWRTVAPQEGLLLFVAVSLYVTSNVLIAAGIRNARLALTAPLRYAAVPAAIALDLGVFGIQPNTTATVGTIIIVGSGLATVRAAYRK